MTTTHPIRWYPVHTPRTQGRLLSPSAELQLVLLLLAQRQSHLSKHLASLAPLLLLELHLGAFHVARHACPGDAPIMYCSDVGLTTTDRPRQPNSTRGGGG